MFLTRILYYRIINSEEGSTTMDPHQPPPPDETDQTDNPEIPMDHTTIETNDAATASVAANGDGLTAHTNANTASGHFANGLGRLSGPQGHFERPQGHSATNPTNPDPVQNVSDKEIILNARSFGGARPKTTSAGTLPSSSGGSTSSGNDLKNANHGQFLSVWLSNIEVQVEHCHQHYSATKNQPKLAH